MARCQTLKGMVGTICSDGEDGIQSAKGAVTIMRLVTYRVQNNGGSQPWRAGIVVGEPEVESTSASPATVLDATDLAQNAGLSGDWGSVRAILTQSLADQATLARAAAQAQAPAPGHPAGHSADHPAAMAITNVQLGPPIPDPDKIICLGLNYHEHQQETNLPTGSIPVLFAKFRNALTGPYDPIVLTPLSSENDYEAELAVVIGRRCKNVSEADALDYVGGVMAFDDVTARDMQFKTSQWMPGKALDTYAPCGPWLVTMDEVSDVQNLDITTRVNGVVLQQSNTRLMIFSVRAAVAFISSVMTLEPGDIIATGTPAGVGFTRQPPIFLHHGDIVEVEIGGIGLLRNPVSGPH